MILRCHRMFKRFRWFSVLFKKIASPTGTSRQRDGAAQQIRRVTALCSEDAATRSKLSGG